MSGNDDPKPRSGPSRRHGVLDEQVCNYAESLSKQQFLMNFCVSLKYRYMFAPVPKAAHSTLKLLLSQVEVQGLPIATKDLKVHEILSSPFVHPFQLTPSIFDEVIHSEEFYRFTIVRDPYERAVSCYLDKILRPSPERHIIARKLNCEPAAEISFYEFLTAISRQRPVEMDMHWKPQTDILLWNEIQYHYVGRMEELVASIDTIFRQITGEPAANVVEVRSVRHHATDAVQLKADYIKDDKVRQLMKEIYRRDFEALSYDSM